MGFSVSASFGIVAIAVIASIGILFGTVSLALSSYTDAVEYERESIEELKNSEVEVTDTQPDEITIRNTGGSSLHLSEFTVLFDDEIVEQTSSVAVIEGDEERRLLNPSEEMTISVEEGVEFVKIVTESNLSLVIEVDS